MRKVPFLIFLIATTTSTILAASSSAKWEESVVQVEAKETGVFNDGKGVGVPKVYVLDLNGKITYENDPASKRQSSEAVVAALKHSMPIASKDQASLTGLLMSHGHNPTKSSTYTLVTLEFGDSVGKCVACEIFYPAVQADLSSAELPLFHWVHVKLEKNGYKQ